MRDSLCAQIDSSTHQYRKLTTCDQMYSLDEFIEAYGGTHQAAPFDGVCVDAENMVVTSPAYMYEGQPHEVFDSVGVMVSETLRLQTLQVSERLR